MTRARKILFYAIVTMLAALLLVGCTVAPTQGNLPSDTPSESEIPVEPEAPAEPETPVEPEAPAEPETPVEPETPAEPEVVGTKYILNTSSKKYHVPGCYQAKRIAAKNYSEYTGTADELKSMGYTPCGTCH